MGIIVLYNIISIPASILQSVLRAWAFKYSERKAPVTCALPTWDGLLVGDPLARFAWVYGAGFRIQAWELS